MLNRSKFLSDAEIDHLMKVCKRNRHDRNALAFELILRTGARSSELLQLTPADLFPESRTVLIRGAKGSRDREIPLPQEFFDALEVYARGISTNRIFPLSWEGLRRHWYNYRPCKKSMHSLRHTFAIRLFRKTKDIKLVQMALGHKDISNTVIYADYAYSTDELRKAMPFKWAPH